MLWDPKWQVEVTRPALEPWQKVLMDAADVIEKRGWCKGRLESADGAVCTMGALIKAVSGAVLGGAYRTASSRFEAYIGTKHVGMWNDNPSRTKEQVVFALCDCALNGGE